MRDMKRCDACGLVVRGWCRVVLTRAGSPVRTFVLCLACADDAEQFVARARRVA